MRCYCDLNLTFDIDEVTLNFKTLSGLYLRNCQMYKADTQQGYWLESVGMQTLWCDCDLTFDLAEVIWNFKVLLGLYLRNCNCKRLIHGRGFGKV